MYDNAMENGQAESVVTKDWLEELNDDLNCGLWEDAREAFCNCLRSEISLAEIGTTLKSQVLEFSDDGYCGALADFLNEWRPLLDEEPKAFILVLEAVGVSVRQQIWEGQLKSLNVTLKGLEAYPANFKDNIMVVVGKTVEEMAVEFHPYLVPTLDVLRSYPAYHDRARLFVESTGVATTPLDIQGEEPTHIIVAFEQAKYLFWRQEPRISTGKHVDKSVDDVLKIWSGYIATRGKGLGPIHAKYTSSLLFTIFLAEDFARRVTHGNPSINKKREAATRRAKKKILGWARKYGVPPV